MNTLICARSFLDALKSAFIVDNRWLTYLKGMGITLLISLLAIIIGVIIGLIIAVIKNINVNTGKLKILNAIGNLYVTVIRGIPVVVLLLVMNFGILISFKKLPVVDGVPIGGIIIAAITFGLNSAAYVAEIFRAGILSVDKGQMEAGRSLGLGYGKTMAKIIIPQALKNSIPPLGNEFIALIKETSIVSMISVVDLTFAATIIAGNTADYMTAMGIAAVFYLIIVLSLTYLMKFIERRLSKSDKRN